MRRRLELQEDNHHLEIKKQEQELSIRHNQGYLKLLMVNLSLLAAFNMNRQMQQVTILLKQTMDTSILQLHLVKLFSSLLLILDGVLLLMLMRILRSALVTTERRLIQNAIRVIC